MLKMLLQMILVVSILAYKVGDDGLAVADNIAGGVGGLAGGAVEYVGR